MPAKETKATKAKTPAKKATTKKAPAKKAVKKPSKMGAPTKYTDDMPSRAFELFKIGASKAEICLELDICFDTFQEYQANHPDFLEAVKKGMQISQGWWEMKGRKATVGEVEGFNATSFIFNMKNRFKHDWKDKQEIDNTHSFGDISEEELDEKIRRLSGDT